MFEVQGSSVLITRGDAASFDIVFGVDSIEETGNPAIIYPTESIPEDGTHIRFSVKQSLDKPRCVIEKDMVVWNGFTTVSLESKDTAYLPFGEYYWDIRLYFDNVGGKEPNTPIIPFSFYVTEVVGNAYL